MLNSQILEEKQKYATSINTYKNRITELNPQLQRKITSRPLYTILNSQSSQSNDISNYITIKRTFKRVDIPNVFNGIEIWKDFLTPPKNQGNCGGCWSFASVGVLADRFNIMSKNNPRVDLSPLRPIICNIPIFDEYLYSKTSNEIIEEKEAEGLIAASCYGNSLINAFRYIYVFGTTTELCNPYNEGGIFYRPLGEFEEDKDLPLCSTISSFTRDMCDNYVIDVPFARLYGIPARFYRFGVIYSVPGTPKQNSSYEEIMYEIFKWGPVATGFIVYSDFYTFDPKTEIYKWNGEGESVGGHAVEIVGWGEDNGIKYWWIKNSWGEDWGINGYFKFIRGENNCEIEENVYSGIPGFFNTLDSFFTQNFKNTNIIKDDKYLRDILDLGGIGVISGGIEPYTGYSRRALEYYPGLATDYPIEQDNIPDMTKFVAGKITSVKTQPKIEEKPNIKPKLLIDENKNLFSIYFLSFIFGLYSYFYKNPVILLVYISLILIFNKDILTQIIFIFIGGLIGFFIHPILKLKPRTE